jgi:hypothetical protein
MRKFHVPEIRFSQTVLILYALSTLFLTASTEARAQYYLADCKHEASSTAYQNVDYSDLSGVSTNIDESAPGASDDCMGGFITMFLSIAGACIGFPLIAIFALSILLGNGVRSARMQKHHFADLYLDAPPQPLRWYDPLSKNLLETVRK